MHDLARFIRLLYGRAMIGMSHLLPGERQALIRQRLATAGRVIAVDLARELETSEDTIRRDLRDLAAAGVCKRVYGGALPISAAGGSVREREGRDRLQKAALAQVAARLVRPGQILFIDAGTTNAAIARALPNDAGLTVATNAPEIALALLGRPGFEVILVGGHLDHESGGTLGVRALRDAQAIRADLCFLGACAVETDAGVTGFNAEDAAFKRAIAEISGSVVVAATSEKIGTAAPFAIIPAAEIGDLVAGAEAPAVEIQRLLRLGIRVHRADGIAGETEKE
jgi:DeoR/GlpR family transcriptional regulator of sugar metabolism